MKKNRKQKRKLFEFRRAMRLLLATVVRLAVTRSARCFRQEWFLWSRRLTVVARSTEWTKFASQSRHTVRSQHTDGRYTYTETRHQHMNVWLTGVCVLVWVCIIASALYDNALAFRTTCSGGLEKQISCKLCLNGLPSSGRVPAPANRATDPLHSLFYDEFLTFYKFLSRLNNLWFIARSLVSFLFCYN